MSTGDKPDVAALIAIAKWLDGFAPDHPEYAEHVRRAAAALQSQAERVAALEARDMDSYHYNRAETAEAERDALRADAVPREPTELMIEAVADDVMRHTAIKIWQAMLDAARAKEGK